MTLWQAAQSNDLVPRSVHAYYRYPARFSLTFAATAIEELSRPGELILDPFLGGSTSLVAAVGSSRSFVGTDINAISIFIGRAMLARHDDDAQASLQQWLAVQRKRWSYRQPGFVDTSNDPRLTNAVNIQTKAIIKAAGQVLASIKELDKEQLQQTATCALLKTCQWALDSTRDIPSLEAFRQRYSDVLSILSTRARFFHALRHQLAGLSWGVHQTSAEAVPTLPEFAGDRRRAALIVTSPPYPGVHVLYHRWQLSGRKESPMPYWIVGSQDGMSEAYYTMGGRSGTGQRSYFESMERVYSQLRAVLKTRGHIIQLIGFSETAYQLPRLLLVMKRAGFKLVSDQSLIWRDVPRRSWHARQTAASGAREVVLTHQVR